MDRVLEEEVAEHHMDGNGVSANTDIGNITKGFNYGGNR